MGYYTEFSGYFKIAPALKKEHREYLDEFCASRRMARHVDKLPPDPLREAVGLPPGREGEFHVAADEQSIIDYNRSPCSQPGLWCSFEIEQDGDGLYLIDGKNYEYEEWLLYLLKNFFDPWGYTLSGEVEWQGERPSDHGRLTFLDGKPYVQMAITSWSDPAPLK